MSYCAFLNLQCQFCLAFAPRSVMCVAEEQQCHLDSIDLLLIWLSVILNYFSGSKHSFKNSIRHCTVPGKACSFKSRVLVLLPAWSRAPHRGAALSLARLSAMLVRQRRSGGAAGVRSGRWPRHCPGSAQRRGCPWLHGDVYVVLLCLRVLWKGLLWAHKGEEVVGEQL